LVVSSTSIAKGFSPGLASTARSGTWTRATPPPRPSARAVGGLIDAAIDRPDLALGEDPALGEFALELEAKPAADEVVLVGSNVDLRHLEAKAAFAKPGRGDCPYGGVGVVVATAFNEAPSLQ
jgi:hypothetical protein